MNAFPASSDPATGETVRTYAAHTWEEAAGIIEAVHRAFLEWKRESISNRACLLRAAAGVLRKRKDRLAALVTQEMGKLASEAREEVEKCAVACDYYDDHAGAMLAPEAPAQEAFRAGGGGEGEQAWIIHEPLGVVLALMPWNFPLWQAVRFLAPGLMAGNACVLKHANNTPAARSRWRRCSEKRASRQTCSARSSSMCRRSKILSRIPTSLR